MCCAFGQNSAIRTTCGVTVDIGHCVVVEPAGVRGALLEAGPLLANVQLDDMRPHAHEHLPFGEGTVDLPLALATLAELGYRGVAAVELPRHSHDAPGLAVRSMDALRAGWHEAGTIRGIRTLVAGEHNGDRRRPRHPQQHLRQRRPPCWAAALFVRTPIPPAFCSAPPSDHARGQLIGRLGEFLPPA